MTRTALITGITGQDGAYLARQLVKEGTRVIGLHRPDRLDDWRLSEMGVRDQIELIPADLSDVPTVSALVGMLLPDEVYHLAAQTSVNASYSDPIGTVTTNGLSAAVLLQALRERAPEAHVVTAGSTVMYGDASPAPQSETTPFAPANPYGSSKLLAHWLTVNYRQAFGLHASSAILFNHVSPFTGLEVFARKVTAGLADVKHGHAGPVALGYLDAERDWTFAGDVVDALVRIARHSPAEDYVIGSGTRQTLRRFVEIAADELGMDLGWSGQGPGECGIDGRTGQSVAQVEARFYRPTETQCLIADASRAKRDLGWEATTGFEQIVRAMAREDDRRAAFGRIAR